MSKEALMYEAMYILDASLEPAQVEEVEARLKAGIESAGGTFEAVHDFGRRRLAYKIRGHADGAYRVIYFKGDGAVVAELNREYGIIEEIIRGHVVQANASYMLGNLPKPEPPRRDFDRPRDGGDRRGGPRPPRTEEREPRRGGPSPPAAPKPDEAPAKAAPEVATPEATAETAAPEVVAEPEVATEAAAPEVVAEPEVTTEAAAPEVVAEPEVTTEAAAPEVATEPAADEQE